MKELFLIGVVAAYTLHGLILVLAIRRLRRYPRIKTSYYAIGVVLSLAWLVIFASNQFQAPDWFNTINVIGGSGNLLFNSVVIVKRIAQGRGDILLDTARSE